MSVIHRKIYNIYIYIISAELYLREGIFAIFLLVRQAALVGLVAVSGLRSDVNPRCVCRAAHLAILRTVPTCSLRNLMTHYSSSCIRSVAVSVQNMGSCI